MAFVVHDTVEIEPLLLFLDGRRRLQPATVLAWLRMKFEIAAFVT